MLETNKGWVHFIAILLALACGALRGAPPQKEASAAPVPVQIASARSAFISNAGGACNPFGQVGFAGGPDRAYNQFYEAMRAWGRYTLATTPSEAGLAFEIIFECPAAGARVLKGDTVGPSYDPQLQLVIWDIKTHIVLWAMTEHIELAVKQGNRDKNFDLAIDALVNDLKHLTGATTPPPHST